MIHQTDGTTLDVSIKKAHACWPEIVIQATPTVLVKENQEISKIRTLTALIPRTAQPIPKQSIIGPLTDDDNGP